ncbi:hypothetical protein [Vreelandella alkaliphila]|uniref:Uncharacterized protein n=1 Tax=Vreelandella alkaliphila TaxID=272774 RepID=A0AAJ2S0R1_9GAMM|nr:hypothetical protein [Halomonas alkaliphila]MDX5979631.1 hypothetical protein [Halomonas alkaliphila]
MIFERAAGLSNAEGLAAEKRANETAHRNPARARLIRGIANIRAALPDIDSSDYLFTELERIHHMRNSAQAYRDTTGSLEALKGKETISEAELRTGLQDIFRATAMGVDPRQLEKDALTIKSLAGKQMLVERLGKSRETVDALVGDNAERITTLSNQVSRAIDGVKQRYGGNSGASKAFFASLEDAPGTVSRRPQQTINAMYSQWLRDQAYETSTEYRESIEAAERIGLAVIEQAKTASGYSKRDGAILAAKHVGSGKGLRGVTSRANWSAGQYDADMVELMQVVGKTLPKGARIEIGSKADVEKATGYRYSTGRGRSFQTEGREPGIGSVKKTYICLSGSVDKRVLFHEMGHAIESVNPAVNSMVSVWLKARIEGKQPDSLRRLTGIRTYKNREIAVKDGFIDAYVGKVYEPIQGIQCNEVLAMGLERLANPMAAAQLAAQDPDHLALILAALKVEYQP